MALGSQAHQKTGQPCTGLRWVVAHPREAKHIIQWFRLDIRLQSAPYSIYGDESGLHFLIVSGEGKVASAAATAFLYAFSGADKSTAWINIGTAGHQQAAIGTLMIANRVLDHESNQAWYPSRVFSSSIKSSGLICVSRMETSYPENAMYDLESAGFYGVASKFTTHELIHCMKVVSDNRSSEPSREAAQNAMDSLISQQDAVRCFIDDLINLSREESERLSVPLELGQFLQQWSFTVSQQHQLASLMRQWDALGGASSVFASLCEQSLTPKQVLRILKQQLFDEVYVRNSDD